jgi:hypothetical protein
VSRRFVKKQQMQWTLKGAHLLLQTLTKVLNNELEHCIQTMVSAVSHSGEGRSLPPDLEADSVKVPFD